MAQTIVAHERRQPRLLNEGSAYILPLDGADACIEQVLVFFPDTSGGAPAREGPQNNFYKIQGLAAYLIRNPD